jgi:ABC-2 type transport system permease protein
VSLAVHAEWTKLRTLSATAWLLLATVVLTAALGAASDSTAAYTALGPAQDTTKASLTGVVLGQAVIAALAVLAIGSEYSTGTIQTTLTAIPRRCTVLAAKAAVVLAAVLPAAAVGVLCSLVAGRLILPGSGFTAAHGYPPLSLADGSTLRAAAGSVIYLGLIALLGLGVGAAVRDSATAIGIVLGLLYIFPIVAQTVTDPTWQRHLHELAPMTAGLYIQATVGVHGLPITPWQGLGVLAGWAAAALLAGGILLRVRDA